MENKNQCYGVFTEDTGYGPAYQYACLHSGSNEYSGGNTSWYNYTLASAGTIYDENIPTQENPANNTTTATESICPKGWTLPSNAQIDSNKNAALFSPVLGGIYGGGNLNSKDKQGRWWGSEAYTGPIRWTVDFNDTNTNPGRGRFYRSAGYYIRCVQAS